VQFGAQLVNYFTDWERSLATVQAIDAGPWSSLWFSDHFVPPNSPRELEKEAALESYSMLSAAAAVTDRVRLGVMVTGNTYRNPAHLAKIATTIDHISGGRFELGIGAAWHQREHEAYGWDFPPLKERCDRLEEAVELIRLLFTADGPVDYNGQYYQLDQAPMSPRSTQSPQIPILVGGNGEKRTLRTCAKYADICNIDFWNPGGVDVYLHKMDILKRHCEKLGTDYDAIKKTMLIPLRIIDDEKRAEAIRERAPWYCYGSASYIIDLLGGYIDIGIEEIMFAGIPSEARHWQRIEEDVLSAFGAGARV